MAITSITQNAVNIIVIRSYETRAITLQEDPRREQHMNVTRNCQCRCPFRLAITFYSLNATNRCK